MPSNGANLQKLAIDAALKGDWEAAVELNEKFLKKNPDDIGTKIRLGRAYIQTKQFSPAKRIFTEVLSRDPVNKIALKNLQIAKNKKLDRSLNGNLSPKTLIKEPGMATEAKIKTSESKVAKLTTGDPLFIKIKKASADIFNKNTLLGTIEDPKIVKDLNSAKSQKEKINASFIKGRGELAVILLTATEIPVFKSEKQDVKPYIKKGTIEEPELQMAAPEEQEDLS